MYWGSTSPMALTTFSSTLTCPKHLPYKVPSLSYLLSTLLSISSWACLSLHHHLPAMSQFLFIQHNSSFLSTWPNHLNLFLRITSAMSSIARMLLTHSLRFLGYTLHSVYVTTVYTYTIGHLWSIRACKSIDVKAAEARRSHSLKSWNTWNAHLIFILRAAH